jgi:hypothetical protein
MSRRRPADEPIADSVPFPDATKGYYPTPCEHERCGHPQGAGRPRSGWVQTKAAGDEHAVWHCSFRCASIHLIKRELRGAA